MTNLYKAIDAKETIKVVREAFRQLSIFVRETKWFHPQDKLYSCMIEIPDTDITAFGKGADINYCLASAYGELIEEINTGIMFSSFSLSEKTKAGYDFILDPCEYQIKIGNGYKLPDSLEHSIPFQDGTSLKQYYKRYEETAKDELLLTLPFYDLFKDKTEYIPSSFVNLINGSNGICAGNTKYEALVHGLCEILERYSVKMYFFQKLSAPTISKHYLKQQFYEVSQVIERIERDQKYRVIVKDVSLNGTIPVLAVCIFDLEQNKYAINFGSDPDLGIALQRCLTEIYQGNSAIDERMSDFDFSEVADNNEYNKFIKSGKGKFPYTFFLSDQMSEPITTLYPSLEEKFKSVLQCFRKLGADSIYIRDCSYIALKSYQILIPGISEVMILPDAFQSIRQRKEGIYYLSHLHHLNQKELQDFAIALELHISYRFHGVRKFIQDFINIQFDHEQWDNITIEGILFLLYFKLQKMEKAVLWLCAYIEVLKDNQELDQYCFYTCLRDALNLCKEQIKPEDARKILENYYEETWIEHVFFAIKHPSYLFDQLTSLLCFDCDNCQNQMSCNYKKKEKIYHAVMQRKRAGYVHTVEV